MNKVTVAWNGFMASLEKAIEEWKPKTEATELGYRTQREPIAKRLFTATCFPQPSIRNVGA